MADSSKKMGLMGLTTLVTVNMMGSGIIMLPTNMAQLGAVSLLSWIFTAIGSMAIAYCFAQCGVFCPRSGGLSAYTEEAHGKVGLLPLLVPVLPVAGYRQRRHRHFGGRLHDALLALAGHRCHSVVRRHGRADLVDHRRQLRRPGHHRQDRRVHCVGRDHSGGGPVLIGWFWFKPDVLAAAWNPTTCRFPKPSAKHPLTLWAFLGMESAAQATDAVENPKRNVPLACLFGTLGAAVIYILSTTVIQGIVPNAELAKSIGALRVGLRPDVQPDGRQYHHGAGGDRLCRLAAGLAVHPGQTAKMTADQSLFPKLSARSTARCARRRHDCRGVLQTLMALSTMSPDAAAQFSKLVSLAAVTNMIPYMTAMTGLLVIMHKAGGPRIYSRNLVALLIAITYSLYALYACGKDAVMGGTLVLAVGYLLYGFLAKRFTEAPAANQARAANP